MHPCPHITSGARLLHADKVIACPPYSTDNPPQCHPVDVARTFGHCPVSVSVSVSREQETECQGADEKVVEETIAMGVTGECVEGGGGGEYVKGGGDEWTGLYMSTCHVSCVVFMRAHVCAYAGCICGYGGCSADQ